MLILLSSPLERFRNILLGAQGRLKIKPKLVIIDMSCLSCHADLVGPYGLRIPDSIYSALAGVEWPDVSM